MTGSSLQQSLELALLAGLFSIAYLDTSLSCKIGWLQGFAMSNVGCYDLTQPVMWRITALQSTLSQLEQVCQLGLTMMMNNDAYMITKHYFEPSTLASICPWSTCWGMLFWNFLCVFRGAFALQTSPARRPQQPFRTSLEVVELDWCMHHSGDGAT